MNKLIRKSLMYGFIAIIPSLILSCPITLKNDGSTPIWVVTPKIANKIEDVTSSQDIEKAARDSGIDQSQYKKIKVEGKGVIGKGKDKDYYVYIKVPKTKRYIRLFQVQVTTCTPKKGNWWKKNYLSISQLKNKLTSEQAKHIKVTDLRTFTGYSFSKAYNQFLNQLKAYWDNKKVETMSEPEERTVKEGFIEQPVTPVTDSE